MAIPLSRGEMLPDGTLVCGWHGAEFDCRTPHAFANPTSGTLSGTPPNLSYLANPGFTGTDSFTFAVSIVS